MSVRYLTTLGVAMLLAVAATLGVTAARPDEAEAAGKAIRGCTGTKISLNANEYRSLQLHNKARADRGLKKLCVHPRLQAAARAHSRDMIQRDYFSHDTLGRNESSYERMKRYGYSLKGYRSIATGENIAWGTGPQGAPGAIFRAWMNSNDHRPNILSRKFREVGIGAVTGTYQGNANATMYTADFGVRQR